MPMDKITHEIRLSRWAAIVEECARSGMPKTKWCMENEVDVKQFYYWQRRVREEVYNEITTKALPATTFAELQVPSLHNTVSSPGAGATVRINDITIEISNNCSMELLQTILRVSAHVQ